MATVTVRPDSTSGSITTTGGSAHACLSDNSDATWVTAGSITLGLGDPVLPADAMWKSWQLRSRDYVLTDPVLGLFADVFTDVDGTTITVFWTTPTTHVLLAGAMPASLEAWLGSPSVELQVSANLIVTELYMDLIYVAKPVVAVSGPTGTLDTTNLPTITWADTLDSDGGAQTAYEVKVFDDATYGAGGFDPATSTPDAQSGIQSGTATSWRVGDEADESLANDTYKAYVRVAQMVNGETFWSDWDAGSAFTIDVPLPAPPTIAVAGEDANGRISIDLEEGVGGEVSSTYIQVQRSLDGGVTWE